MDCKSSPHWPVTYVWSRISCFRKPRKGLRALKAIAKVTSGIEIFSIHSDTITWLFSVSYYFWTFVYFFFFFFTQVWNIPSHSSPPPTVPNCIYSSNPISNFLQKDFLDQPCSPHFFALSWTTTLYMFALSSQRICELLKAVWWVESAWGQESLHLYLLLVQPWVSDWASSRFSFLICKMEMCAPA